VSASGRLSFPVNDAAAITKMSIDDIMNMRFFKIKNPNGWQCETQIYQ
jgi:hypothetical protein